MKNAGFQAISIIAVFTAMGVGLALGAVAHDAPASGSMHDELSALTEHNDRLRTQIDQANRDGAVRDAFAEELVPTVLARRLAGARVLIVATPSGVDSVEGVRRVLSIAGASLTGTIEVTAKFSDPRYEDELLDLAHTVLPSSVVGRLPAGVDGVGATSALLSVVLLARSQPVTAQDRRTALISYASQGYLLGTEAVSTPADVVVVVSGEPASGADATRRNTAMVTMVTQFDQAGRVAVAGTNDAGAGNLVTRVRHDPQLRLTVSTVDNVATAPGRLVLAWAAADQIAGKAGHYGVGAGATLLPKLPP
jgi:hypothetical protein